MGKKKIIIIVSIIVTLICIGLAGYYFIYSKDNNNLTSLDKQWIEKNKNTIIDISVVNNLPVFNYNGEGVLFDFIENMNTVLGLDFNELPSDLDENTQENLGFFLVEVPEKDDVTIYKDNYVILTKDNKVYNNLEDIVSLNIGVFKNDLENVRYYLKANKNIIYTPYNTYDELFEQIKIENNNLDGIIVPKITYFKSIIEDDSLHIAYNISDMYKSLVLRLGNDKNLNSVVSKYLKKWYETKYQESFNTHFTSDYFNFKNITEQEKTNFKTGKTYTYGFVDYAPYDSIVNKSLVGINNSIIENFANLNDIEIKWKEYKNNKDLVNDFNNGKVDFFLDTTSILEYNIDNAISNTSFNDRIVVLSKNEEPIKSLSSLKDKSVITIADSKINQSLLAYNIDTKTYGKLSSLLKNKKDDDIIVIDYLTYNVYKNDLLNNYNISYSYDLDTEYKFVSSNSNENKVFSNYFMFYLDFIDFSQYANSIKPADFKENLTIKVGPYLAIIALIAIIIGLILYFAYRYKTKEKKTTINKDYKIKYIDVLTSLKNRAYLNDSIEKWDESEIYPQSIVVVDLNNVAYINDNYGHQEGDNLIKEAAAILVNNQIENTEIMRTNGNEFLIYMVNYDEKQVVTYIRKLNKDFKELSHGFGAAVGYSMINDPIKTIDDAINEATLDMKNNKEELQN